MQYELDESATSVMFYIVDPEGRPKAHARAMVSFGDKTTTVESDGYGAVVVPKPDGATHGQWHPHSNVYEFHGVRTPIKQAKTFVFEDSKCERIAAGVSDAVIEVAPSRQQDTEADRDDMVVLAIQRGAEDLFSTVGLSPDAAKKIGTALIRAADALTRP